MAYMFLGSYGQVLHPYLTGLWVNLGSVSYLRVKTFKSLAKLFYMPRIQCSLMYREKLIDGKGVLRPSSLVFFLLKWERLLISFIHSKPSIMTKTIRLLHILVKLSLWWSSACSSPRPRQVGYKGKLGIALTF